jgi:MinD superfamily P-loop ATPase
MKEIVVISGKGGTGKTSVTASFGVLAGKDAIIADCDVDAADMHLLLQPDKSEAHDFYSGEVAVIDPKTCSFCGLCKEECRFNAIRITDGRFEVDPIKCEGCGYCARICPEKAISNRTVRSGRYFISAIRTGTTMVHARLSIGASNSGKLVATVKETARKQAAKRGVDIILVDGSPGTGCPVISSLAGASYVVFVTEPTISGFHDLRRVAKLTAGFKIPAGCIINKSDLNPEMTRGIRSFLGDNGISLLGEVPYDASFSKAITMGKTVMECENGRLAGIINGCWENIMQII